MIRKRIVQLKYTPAGIEEGGSQALNPAAAIKDGGAEEDTTQNKNLIPMTKIVEKKKVDEAEGATQVHQVQKSQDPVIDVDSVMIHHQKKRRYLLIKVLIKEYLQQLIAIPGQV